MIAALEASAGQSGVCLAQLVCAQRLGQDTLQDFRQLLANHLPFSSHLTQRVWPVLRQFSIFETADGSLIDLANDQLQLLPNPRWEGLICTASHTVPWKVIKYFTGSDTQRKLLRQSGLKAPTFLDQTLLGSIQTCTDSAAQGLLRHALQDMAAYPTFQATKPDQLLVNNQPVAVAKLVYGTSPHLHTLFADSPTGQKHLGCMLALAQTAVMLPTTLINHLAESNCCCAKHTMLNIYESSSAL